MDKISGACQHRRGNQDRGRGMLHSKMLAGALLAGALSWVVPVGATGPGKVDLTPYLKQDRYDRVKISPDGRYYAVTVPLEDRTALVIVRRSDQSPTTKITGGPDSVVEDFWWANPERVVVSMAKKYGSRDEPYSIGELHA